MNQIAIFASDAQPPSVSIEEIEADPHGVFRRFRPIFPFIRRPDGVPVILRATDIRQLVVDPRVRQPETEFIRLRGVEDGPLFRLFQEGMLTSNGAVHRSRRAPFAQTFAFRLIARLRPQIRAVADDILDSWPSEGETDLLESFASPLPARIIAAILGLPSGDVPVFTRLVYSVARVLSAAFAPEDLPVMQEDARQLFEYVERLLSDRRRNPVDDFLTSYLAALDETGQLSASESIVQIAILILGGSDTTRAAMASLISLLLQHGEYANLHDDPTLIPSAVSEGLRFEPSVGSVGRVTLEPIELGGHLLPANQFMTLSTMSAMRDGSMYRDPDVFDIRRTDQQRWHMVFGGGAHRCLGEALARAELEEGLAALVSRVPRLRLTGIPAEMDGQGGIRRIGPVPAGWTALSRRLS